MQASNTHASKAVHAQTLAHCLCGLVLKGESSVQVPTIHASGAVCAHTHSPTAHNPIPNGRGAILLCECPTFVQAELRACTHASLLTGPGSKWAAVPELGTPKLHRPICSLHLFQNVRTTSNLLHPNSDSCLS